MTKIKFLSILALLCITVSSAWGQHKPNGSFEGSAGGHGSFLINGWAWDQDADETPITVHVYAFKSSTGDLNPVYPGNDNVQAVFAVTADKYRSDLDEFSTGYHCFSDTYLPLPAGTYFVGIWGIDTGADGSEQIGDLKEITVEDPYAVTYNANEGTGSVASQDKRTGINLTLASSGFTRTGYTLDGWATSAGGAKAYDLGATYTGNAALSLYAHWTPIASYNVTANSASEAYWATFYSNAGNYQAAEGTQVFTVSLAGTGITMHEVSDRIAKSGQGVVLKKTATGNFTMTLTETAPAGDFSSNNLDGTMTQINTTGANDYYVLGGKNGAGFYKLSNTSGTIGANKAYLTYSGGGAAAARGFFLFDETTGIEMPTAEDGNADAVVFDLQGRRVLNPTKGLYIVNGKKVFINK